MRIEIRSSFLVFLRRFSSFSQMTDKSIAEYLSRVDNFNIIESTLRGKNDPGLLVLG